MATAEPDRDPRRRQPLDGGRLLAGIGALALLISLFLDWYGPPGDGVTGLDGDGITAWTAFELVDIVLAALALITIAWAIEGIAGSDHPLIDSRVGTAAGPTALVLVVVSIINEPPLMSSFGADLDAGAWVALAGAVVMTIGGLLRHARISITVTPRERPTAEAETRAMAEEPRRPAP